MLLGKQQYITKLEMCPSEHEWPASQHSVKWGRHQLIKEAMVCYWGSNNTLPKKKKKHEQGELSELDELGELSELGEPGELSELGVLAELGNSKPRNLKKSALHKT